MNQNIRIVEATERMLPEILEIENASFTVPWSEKSFREAFDADHITVLAAIDEETDVLGFGCLLAVDGEGEILNIAVRPDVRKAGIGRALLGEMIIVGFDLDVREFYLEVRESNTPARSLYEKLGFVTLGRRKRYYSKPVEDAILMKKTLNIPLP